MLHAALTRSPHAHAAVLGIDVTTALASPGVVDVLIAADLPGQLCTGPARADRPVLAAGVVRHQGEPLAAVLATDPASAARAAAAVAVRYRELPAVHWFRGEDADPIHPDGNVLRSVRVRRGSWPAAAALVVEGNYNTHGWVPAAEPFGIDGMPAVPSVVEVEPTDDGVRITAPRRWHPSDRDQLAPCLNLTPSQIVLESTGASDHSTDLGGTVLAALFALRNHRLVRLVLGPSYLGLGGGPTIAARYQHHARADGTLLALRAEIDLESGPYAGVFESLVAQLCAIGAGPYRVPAVDLRVRALRSTTPPPMVEPGLAAAAVTFAVEAQLDRLADRIAFGEVGRERDSFVAGRRAIRQRNLLELDDPLPTGQVTLEDSPHPALLAALDAVALPAMPDLTPEQACGVGIGVGMVPYGASEGGDLPVRATVRVSGKPTVWCPAAEGDAHLEAAAVGVVEQAFGTPAEFQATGEPVGGGSAATVGRAVQAAVDELTGPARARLAAPAGLSAGLLRAVQGRLRSFDEMVDEPLAAAIAGDPQSATASITPGATEALGVDGQGDAFAGYSYAAARAVLRMTSRGEVEIVQLVVAADCGRVLDPERARAAVEASAFTGIRLAMPEAALAPDAVQVHLLDGPAPKGVAGVAAGAVAAALRSAADHGAGGDAEVLPIPGVSWTSVSTAFPAGDAMPPRYTDPLPESDGAS